MSDPLKAREPSPLRSALGFERSEEPFSGLGAGSVDGSKAVFSDSGETPWAALHVHDMHVQHDAWKATGSKDGRPALAVRAYHTVGVI